MIYGLDIKNQMIWPIINEVWPRHLEHLYTYISARKKNNLAEFSINILAYLGMKLFILLFRNKKYALDEMT